MIRENSEQERGGESEEILPLDPKNFEGLKGDQLFAAQRDAILQHFIRAYSTNEASRDRDQAAVGIREVIETNGFFVADNALKRSYENRNFDPDALSESLKRWRADTVREVLSTLESLGKIDGAKVKN